MKTLQHDGGVLSVSLEGLSLADVGRLGESAVARALDSVLGAGEAEGEVVAAFSNEG